MKPGNKKGTNPGPPARTRRTRRTAIVLKMTPPVLNGTAANCGPPSGTKRPQVQILSPDQCHRPLSRTNTLRGRRDFEVRAGYVQDHSAEQGTRS
jgi:hypothetical protein